VVTYADTSFLISMYTDDENTSTAHRFLQKSATPILLTSFSRSETQHALRLVAFRGQISQAAMAQHLLTFARDEQEGFFELNSVDFDSVISKTSQLSNRHALERGVRYMDTLHVASALLANAKRFLTFDLRQRKLAKALGLDVKI
jgi:predicted nucleic acid-binding protein